MNNRPNDFDIHAAWGSSTSRKELITQLRSVGFKFSTAWLIDQLDSLGVPSRQYRGKPEYGKAMEKIWAEDDADLVDDLALTLDDDEPSEPHEVASGGVVESADKARPATNARTLVFTTAQNNTDVHSAFLASLLTFCDHRDAELHISQFTYNKSAYGKKSVKPGSDMQEGEKLWFDPAIAPYVSDTSLQLTSDLVWCGELNVIPTMKFPLTQFKTYTRQASAIIPHAKMGMESVPTMKGVSTKMLYTTGAVTQRNYIAKTAGQVADFHHVFGALVVELGDNGEWWARQINATDDGTFYDLTEFFTPDGVTSNVRVEAITHGDIHWEKRDDEILEIVFAPGGVVDALYPREQFFHDTVDFAARNHHNIKDSHFLHEMMVAGTDSVEREFTEAGDWMSTKAYREWAKTFIVTSNHDQAVEIWLRNPAAMTDPKNVQFWHMLNHYCHDAISRGKKPRPFGFALTTKMSGAVMQNMQLLHEDDSYLILGKIEAGLHGHLGPNGARGAPKNLRTVGKANTGHTHTAGIVDGVYTTGLYAKFDMGYNKGLSSWSHSFCITYPNAKRAIVTIRNGRAWR